MAHRTAQNLNLPRKLLLASAVTAAVVTPIAIGFLIAPRIQAQTPAAGPQFDVASVKPAAPPTTGKPVFLGMVSDPGRFTASYETLADLIAKAWGVAHSRIVGGPQWISEDRFDVIATLPQGAPSAQIPLMLQALLAERFGLTVGRETRMSRVYALVEAKSGLKLTPADPAGPSPNGGAVSSVPISIGRNGALGICCGRARLNKVSMERFAEMLSAQTDRPVQDQTGIQGVFNISLEWTPTDPGPEPGREGAPPSPPMSPPPSPDAPSIYTAVQEQLGLRLEPRTAPVEYLVIERAEKPTEN